MTDIADMRDDVLRSHPIPLPNGEGKFVAGALERTGTQ